MSIIDSRRARKGGFSFLIVGLLALLGACASVPYQQMSDARQAIESADPVVTDGAEANDLLKRARDLLQTAEQQLEAGDYAAARKHAEQAKRFAIEAREQARSNAESDP